MGYINVADNRDNLQSVVNTATEIEFHKIKGIPLLVGQLLDSEDEFPLCGVSKGG